MALININFYNYLKEAIAYKLNNPAAGFYRSSLYIYNLNYSEIFREARAIFPQKYNNSHYFLHNTSFPFLNDVEKNQLNMDFARDLVKGFGGMDVANLQNQNPDQELINFENDVLKNSKFEALNKTTEDTERPANISNFPQQNKEEQEDQTEQQQGGKEESSNNQPARQTPRREPQRVQPREKKSATEKSIDRHNRKLEKRKPENKEARKKARKARRQQRRAREKFNNSRLGRGLGRIGRELTKAKNILNAPNRLLNRLGERFSNSKLGKNLAKINSFLGAPGRFLNKLLNNLGNRFATRFLNNRFGRALGKVGRGLNALDKFLNPIDHFVDKMVGKLASKLGRLAWQGAKIAARLAIQAARALANLAIRALSNLASQAAGGVARAAVGAAGRGVVGLLGGIGVAGIVWIAIAALVIFTIWSLYDSNSECGQPGTVEAKKSTTKESYSEKENIQYKIVIRYLVKCKSAYADIEIKDNIPSGTKFIQGSTKPGIFEENFYLLPPEGKMDGNSLIWRLNKIQPNIPIVVVFSVTPTDNNIWISNQATVGYKTYATGIFGIGGGATGVYTDATGLLPNPLTPTPANWSEVRALVTGAFNKHPELIDRYKQASEQTGIPWQLLAGIHFVEKANGPGPDTSLVSGRIIGQVEPDISPAKCASGQSGPGIPIPIGGGCGFSSQTDSMIYAAKHLAEKIGKTPSTFQEAVTALSRYNGTGNRNCDRGLPYEPCPPRFDGDDDPYAMADFDETHSNTKMYVIYCFDGLRCNPPKIFGRPGVMGVVRALIEEGR